MSGMGLVGIGVDLVDVARLRRALEARAHLAERLFTPGERDDAGRFLDPWPHLAARFAAKEAGMKALGVGLGAFGFRELEVVRAPSGAPQVVVSGRAARLAAAQGVTAWRCSLTHTDRFAEAVVAGLGGLP